MKKTTKRKTQKKPSTRYSTVGVRFLTPDAFHVSIGKVYTYRIRKGAKVYLGMELVADSPNGPAVVAVVRIDTMPMDGDVGFTYKFLTRKTVAL